MNQEDVKISGQGVLHLAQQEHGLVPLIGLPILRHIPIPSKLVSFLNKEGASQGGVAISEDEYFQKAVQDSEKAYVITSKSLGGYGGYVSVGYFIRKVPLTNKVVAVKPDKIIGFRYSTFEGRIVADLLYDGNTHIPTAAFSHPKNTCGYEHHFTKEYSPVSLVNLQTGNKKVVAEQGKDIDASVADDKTLLAVTIPTSGVPSLIEERKANTLDTVFQPDDLKKVKELNHKKDLDHRCWGDSSCISLETFELVLPGKYPKYRVSMDTQGKIYQAERINRE